LWRDEDAQVILIPLRQNLWVACAKEEATDARHRFFFRSGYSRGRLCQGERPGQQRRPYSSGQHTKNFAAFCFHHFPRVIFTQLLRTDF
jgi:hypothetical protein